MPNLLFRYPAEELGSDQYLFIERGDPALKGLIPRSSTTPFVSVRTSDLAGQVTPEKLAELKMKKAGVVDLFDSKLRELDDLISEELLTAGIPIVSLPERIRGEVPSKVAGKLGLFKFERRWVYWSASLGGRSVDPAFVESIYDNPFGKRAIRINGYSGGIEPSKAGSVKYWHIDTIEALILFAALARSYYRDPDPETRVPDKCLTNLL